MRMLATSFSVTGFTLAVSLAALANGCSSSSGSTAAPSDGGTDTASVTADQAATDAAAAYCARVATCTPFYTLISFGDQATCALRMKTQFLGVLTATGTGSTPGLVEGCAGALPGVSCSDLFSGLLPSACQPVAGTGAKGSACADHSQCATKFCGVDASKGICGVCADAPAAEAACVTGDCQDGYACGSDTKCHKIGALGDACDATHTCNATTSCFKGKCAAPSKVGAACDPAGTAQVLLPCDSLAGLWCNTKTKKCEATIENAATGAACGYSATTGSLTLCSAKDYCNITNATTGVGTCAARAADGGACDARQSGMCTAPATCTGGKCVVKDPSTCK